MIVVRYILFSLLVLADAFNSVSHQSLENMAPVNLEVTPLAPRSVACSERFVAYDLDHVTAVPGGDKVRMFEANGGGVAINDLDNDGNLDIVLANHAGLNSILWNEGGLNFSVERIRHGDSRAVTIVDVDGDDLLDIVFSRTNRAPTYWHNDGGRQFSQQFLSGVAKPLYAINWADLDYDGDLDLVGATYDASLLTDYGQEFITSGNGGIFYYENRVGHFQLTTLATSAQALALVLLDLNADGRLDIWVGNDFALEDQIWYWSQAGWQNVKPLNAMSYSTMGLDFGDVNNDGSDEIFSTDMKPLGRESQGEIMLHAINEGINADPRPAGDTQITANVLLTADDFTDWAQSAGVDATGWSWSGKFGDLDNDGFLDLYVVNGFAEISTFAGLPGHELIQENQAFRNTGKTGFTPMPGWNLGSTRGGRGMSLGDLDNDGDLDIVVNNLRDPAQLFENQMCAGDSVEVDLLWPGSGNTRAIGASLILHVGDRRLYRDVKAASGYVSGDPSRIHFGFPDNQQVRQLEIHWPDGAMSMVDTVAHNTRLKITRTP